MVLSPQPESSELASDIGNVSPITVDAHDTNPADLEFMHDRGAAEEDEEPFMRMKQVRGKYCSTSTVYAEHTIVNPNYDQVIFCIAAIIQAQIFEDWSFSEDMKARYPEYNLEIKLPPEFGGKLESIPDSVLDHETMNDLELREKIISGDVPTIDTIFRFINLLYQNAKYSPECNIISLIYLNRLTSSGKIPLTMANWRGIWLSGIVLAQKVWDDVPLRTSQFNQILPSVSKSVLRDLERRTLNLIEFTTNVKPSLYAKYYFELRTLFCDITGNDSMYQWNLKPLTILEAKQLDMRTKRSVLEIRGARANGDPSVITSPQKLRLTPVPARSVVSSVSGIAGGGGNTTRTNTTSRNVRLLPMVGDVIKTNHTLEDFQRIDTTRYVLS